MLRHVAWIATSIWLSPIVLGIVAFGPLAAHAESYPARPITVIVPFTPGTGIDPPGAGTLQHLSMELVKQELGLDIVHIPYHGAAGALTDLVAGHVDLAFLPVNTALPLASAGKLRMLAVSTPRRSPVAPQVPTFSELGHPKLQFALWYGVFGPAKLPAAIVARWERELKSVLAEPDVESTWLKQGLSPDYAPADELETQVKGDFARWKAVGEKAGVSLD